MISDWQTISLRFGPLDTKTDPKLVEPPVLVSLQNAVYTRSQSISKRHGYDKLSSSWIDPETDETGSINTPLALNTFNNELLCFDGSYMYSYAQGHDQWTRRERCSSVDIELQKIASDSYDIIHADMAVTNGTALYVYEFANGIVAYSRQDIITGEFFEYSIPIGGSISSPRAVAIGDALLALWVDGNNLRCRVLGTSPDPTYIDRTLGSNISSSNLYDVRPYDDRGAIIAYATNSSIIDVLYVTKYGYVGAIGNGFYTPTTIVDHAQNCIAIAWDSPKSVLYVAYHNNIGNTRIAALNNDFTVAQAPMTIDATLVAGSNITIALANDDSAHVYVECSDVDSSRYFIRKIIFTPSSSAFVASEFVRSVGLASHSWARNGQSFVVVTSNFLTQRTSWVMNDAGEIISRHLSNESGGFCSQIGSPLRTYLPSVYKLSDTDFCYATLQTGRLQSANNDLFAARSVTRADIVFDSSSVFRQAELGLSAVLGGGIVRHYDGAALVEHGFQLLPEVVTATVSATSGPIGPGTYAYYAIYSWTDAKGQIHRSNYALAASAEVIGSTDSISIEVPTLRLTNKNNVIIEIYRTLANSSQVAYKITSPISPIANNKSVDYITFSDPYADQFIIANEILYTTGGVLGNDAPEACNSIISAKKRIFGLSNATKSIIYTKAHAIGDAPNFSDFQSISTQSLQPQAIALLDDKIIIFESERIYAMAGDGVNALGVQDTFSPIELVSTDAGCSNPDSIVRTSIGLMFQSSKGIYLLDRSLTVSYIGAAVESYNSATVTSAELIAGTTQVRFSTNTDSCLVYDYYFKSWSVFSNHESTDAVVWQKKYVFIRKDGAILVENPSIYADDGQSYEMLIETAWLKFANLQGFQRIRQIALLGDLKSAHQLEVSFAYDYRQYYEYTSVFDTATALPVSYYGDDPIYGDANAPVFGGNATDNVYQFRVHLPRHKCTALKLRIRDTSSFGESYALSGLDCYVKLLSGLSRLPRAKTL